MLALGGHHQTPGCKCPTPLLGFGIWQTSSRAICRFAHLRGTVVRSQTRGGEQSRFYGIGLMVMLSSRRGPMEMISIGQPIMSSSLFT